MRNKLVLLSMICVLSLVFATSAHAVYYYNNFNNGVSDLAGFITTDVLSNGANTPPPVPTQWTASAGAVTLVRSSGTFPEQQVDMVNSTVDIGEIYRCDIVVHSTTFNADLGLVVCPTQTPPAAVSTGSNVDARSNMLTMYLKDGSSGWGNVDYVNSVNVAGQNGYVTAQADYPNVIGLWIKHVGVGEFTEGYTSSVLGDVQFRDVTGVTWDTGSNDYIGLYADVRAVTTYGQLENLRVVPEPATAVMALVGALGMGLIWLRKRG